jgi:hypothetical protein
MGAPAGPYASVRGKLARARQHRTALDRSLKAFRDKRPYLQTIEEPGRPGPGIYAPLPGGRDARGIQTYGEVYTYLDYSIYLEPRPDCPAPSLSCGLLLGDALNNLCGALDNLAWAASRQGLAAAQYPAGLRGDATRAAHEKAVMFPVCLVAANGAWNGHRTSALRFVSPYVRTLIEGYQPFDAWRAQGHDPRLHPFVMIRDLWNRDKHRSVALTVGTASLETISAWRLDGGTGAVECRTEVLEVFGQPIERRTRVGTVRVYLPEPIRQTTSVRIQVHCGYRLDILFGPDVPVPAGVTVRGVLEGAEALVSLLVSSAEKARSRLRTTPLGPQLVQSG